MEDIRKVGCKGEERRKAKGKKKVDRIEKVRSKM
jgi:hypothetical protein